MATEPVRVMTKSYATVRMRYFHFSHTVKNSLNLLILLITIEHTQILHISEKEILH